MKKQKAIVETDFEALERLLDEVGNVINSMGTSKKISHLSVNSLQAHKTRITKGPASLAALSAINLIDKTLAFIDLYNNGNDLEKLKKSASSVMQAASVVGKMVV